MAPRSPRANFFVRFLGIRFAISHLAGGVNNERSRKKVGELVEESSRTCFHETLPNEWPGGGKATSSGE